MMAKGIDTLLRRAGVDMEPPPYKLDPAKRAKLVAKLKTGTYRTQAEAEALADELAKDPVLVAAMHDKNTKTPSSMLQERYNAAYDRTLSPPAKSALDVWHAIQAGDSDIVLGGQHFNPSEKGLCAQVVHKILAASGYPTETGDARETEGWLKANAEKVSGAGMLPGDIVAMNDRGNAHGHIGVYVGGGKVFHEYNPSGGIVVEPLSPLWKTVSGVYRVPPPGGTADTGQQDYAGAFEPPGPPITTPGSPSPQPQQQEPPSAPSGGGGWKINWDD